MAWRQRASLSGRARACAASKPPPPPPHRPRRRRLLRSTCPASPWARGRACAARARRSAGRQTLEDRVRGRRIHYGRAAEVSDYDVSAPASGRLTIYRSRPAAADIPAADIHAAGTDTHADSRRLDTSVSAAAAADDTP